MVICNDARRAPLLAINVNGASLLDEVGGKDRVIGHRSATSRTAGDLQTCGDASSTRLGYVECRREHRCHWTIGGG